MFPIVFLHQAPHAPLLHICAMSLPHPQTITSSEEKAIVEPIEDTSKDDGPSTNGTEQVISAYAGWPASKVIKKFWRLYLRGVLVTFAGM